MTYMEKEEYTDHFLREKMKKWGIIKDEPSEIIPALFSDYLLYSRFLRTEPLDIISEIRNLKRRVHELERKVGEKREPTRADFVYELFRKELEEKHFGKIVAIDTESRKIVGIGDAILEAYNMAKEKTGKDQFDFKRVGYKYIYRV